MKKIAIILSLVLVSITSGFGQTVTDTISMKKVFGGYQFYQGDQLLNINQLSKVVEPNELAYKYIKSAKANYSLAMVSSYAGGFMIGWPIGTALGGGEPNWLMAGIGAGLIVVTIPIIQGFNKKSKLAIDTYNDGLQLSSFWDKSELKFAITRNGVGLALRF